MEMLLEAILNELKELNKKLDTYVKCAEKYAEARFCKNCMHGNHEYHPGCICGVALPNGSHCSCMGPDPCKAENLQTLNLCPFCMHVRHESPCGGENRDGSRCRCLGKPDEYMRINPPKEPETLPPRNSSSAL